MLRSGTGIDALVNDSLVGMSGCWWLICLRLLTLCASSDLWRLSRGAVLFVVCLPVLALWVPRLCAAAPFDAAMLSHPSAL